MDNRERGVERERPESLAGPRSDDHRILDLAGDPRRREAPDCRPVEGRPSAGLILDNIRRAMPDRAKVLLVEHVLPDGDEASFGKLLDLHMMVATGGMERTEAEYRRLFAAHGFRLTRVVPTATDISVVEGVPG
jgi:hypothetical protein